MIRSLTIRGYRGFESFEMQGLGRVNLLVGRNNSGKTSALEALYILARAGDPNILVQMMSRRDERLPEDAESNNRSTQELEYDLCHLFTGHEIYLGTSLEIRAENDVVSRRVTMKIGERQDESQELFEASDASHIRSQPVFEIEGFPEPTFRAIPMTPRGSVSLGTFNSLRRLPRTVSADLISALYISTDSISSDMLARLWSRIALTPDENLVLEAMRTIDRDIERIASIAPTRPYAPSGRGSFIVKLRNHELPIPIGSMGDGIWRMLAMVAAITQCKNGLLIVDEIDTGFHYSVMSSMWQLIESAAKLFNVQVFATTHSSDCVSSLATICTQAYDTEVTIQRIERGEAHAIPYSSREIWVASERGLEVR